MTFKARAIAYALALLVIVLILGRLGQMDYEDAVSEAQFTCDMVHQGRWPAYQARNIECPSRCKWQELSDG